MAGKYIHVQDSAVSERRLRPIYEWLDSGNPKKALQETEKVLRKTPNLQCAKALKALSLLQLGRENECVTILHNLTLESPSDNSTLQAMTICYRDLGQLEKVCNLYETSLLSDPLNEELHTHLFMSYVRCFNYKLQHQAAMALYRLKPKNPYYFWAVMSLVLQATRGPGGADPAQRQVLLAVAERMIEKLIQEGKLEAEQEVQLYLMVLELQGKFSEALKVTEGSLGGKVEGNRLGYLVKLEKWKEVHWVCTEMLQTNMDRWDIWNHYLTSIFNLSNNKNHKNTNHETTIDHLENSLDDYIERAHEFICSLIENISDNMFKSSTSYQLRGPYLARFELYKRLKIIGRDPTTILGDIFELFVEYFRIFGHKSCCVSDLRIYLHLLSSDRRIELANRLLKDVGISSTVLPATEKQMQRHICSLQLSRLCGNHKNLNIEYIKALIAALSLHYENGARQFGGAKLPTDQGPADAYALLAAHTLYDLSRTIKSSTPLIAALVLLENLLKSSPNNFHAKLLCVRLYHMLGGVEGAHRWYESLDTKHLQMDSLGFVHCARVHCAGVLSLTQTLYDSTLKFFSTNYRDSIDHLTFSYKFGSFLKLEEFMDFRERLNNSLHYTITAIDRLLLEMMLCPNLKSLGLIEYNTIDWQSLRDNNDYSVYVSWDPERITDTENTKTPTEILFEQDKDLTRIRAGVLCCISSGLHLIKPSSENKEETAKRLRDVYSDWLLQYKQIELRYLSTKTTQTTARLSQPLNSRLQQQLDMPYRLVIGCLVRLLLGCYSNNHMSSNNGDSLVIDEDICEKDLNVSLSELVEKVEEIVKQQNDSDDCLYTRREAMEFIVNTIELISIASILCAICWELIRPNQPSSSGRKGKKKHNNDTSLITNTPNLKTELSKYISTLQQCCTQIEQSLSTWGAPVACSDLSERLGALAITTTINSETHDAVLKHIKSSHSRAQVDLKSSIVSKLKMLGSMHC